MGRFNSSPVRRAKMVCDYSCRSRRCAPSSRHAFWYACTSLLVGRRDPLGVGLRSAVVPLRFATNVNHKDPRYPTDWLDGQYMAQSRDLLASGPPQARTVSRQSDLAPTPEPLGCWRGCVLGQTLYTPVSDALALGTFRTRLETRTKEFNIYASHWDLLNLKA